MYIFIIMPDNIN